MIYGRHRLEQRECLASSLMIDHHSSVRTSSDEAPVTHTCAWQSSQCRRKQAEVLHTYTAWFILDSYVQTW